MQYSDNGSTYNPLAGPTLTDSFASYTFAPPTPYRYVRVCRAGYGGFRNDVEVDYVGALNAVCP